MQSYLVTLTTSRRTWTRTSSLQQPADGSVTLSSKVDTTPNLLAQKLTISAPIHEWAKYLTTHTNKKVYRYVFDVRNPFPGSSLYQLAHHWVDKYYVFKTLQFRYPTNRLKEISTKHAQLWIDFANGKTPWTEYKYTGHGDEVIMVADEREGWVERTVAEHENITEIIWRTCEVLIKSWNNKKGTHFLPLEIEPIVGKKLV
jgi:hypothetical protein